MNDLIPPLPGHPARSKRAYIELFCDEGTACICYAYPAEEYEAHSPDIGDKAVFEAFAGDACDVDSDDSANAKAEQEATLAVLGWLWQHDYANATWGKQVYGEGRPSWATRDTYEWGTTEPTPAPAGKKKRGKKSENHPPTTQPTETTAYQEFIATVPLPAVDDFVLLAPSPLCLGYVTHAPQREHTPHTAQGYILKKWKQEGMEGEKPYWSQHDLFVVNCFSKEGAPVVYPILSRADVEQRYPFVLESLQYRLDHPQETIAEIEKRFAEEASAKTFATLEAKPEYQAAIKTVTELTPKWKRLTGDEENASETFKAATNVETVASEDRDRDLRKADDRFNEATRRHEEKVDVILQRYNTTKAERDSAKAELEKIKHERISVLLKLGECWYTLREMVPTIWWKQWVTVKAQQFCPGITTADIGTQISMYTELHKELTNMGSEVVPAETVKAAFLQGGLKATAKTKEAMKEVLADIEEAAKSAPREDAAESPSLPRQIADLMQQPSPENEARIPGMLAQAIGERTNGKIKAVRQKAGAAPDKSSAVPAKPPQSVGTADPERLARMAFAAVANAAGQLPQTLQYDWAYAVCQKIFGIGLGVTKEITLVPDRSVVGQGYQPFRCAPARPQQDDQQQEAIPA
jgi:hypothetical protein